MTEATLRITGMTCSSCKRLVESALTSVPGVLFATVQGASGFTTVGYDSTLATTEDMAAAVRKAGYDMEGSAAPKLKVVGCGCCRATPNSLNNHR